jgi:hypothetical protein
MALLSAFETHDLDEIKKHTSEIRPDSLFFFLKENVNIMNDSNLKDGIIFFAPHSSRSVLSSCMKYGIEMDNTTVVETLYHLGIKFGAKTLEYSIEKDSAKVVQMWVNHGVKITKELVNVALGHCSMNVLQIPSFVKFLSVNDLMWSCQGEDGYRDVAFKILDKMLDTSMTQIELQQTLDNLLEYDENDFELFAYFVKGFTTKHNINIDDMIQLSQETTPQKNPIKVDTYPRSGRPITHMTRLLKTPLKEVTTDMSIWKVDVNEFCFCLDIPIGEYKDLYIPVTRYGQSVNIGYYSKEQREDPSFTWYYVEPDSAFGLFSKKTFVARNKFQAFFMFYRQLNHPIDKIFVTKSDQIRSRINRSYETPTLSIIPIEPFLKETEEDVNINGTNFFRNKKTGHIFFEHGGMDDVDELLTKMMQILGYDVLVLTHQPGNYGRLVSECVDSRRRSISFSNIFQIKK